MHDPKRVTRFNNLNNRLYQPRRLSLAVVSLLHDPVKQLPTLTQLHDEVHRRGILVRPFDADNVRVLRQVVHYLNLPPHVLVVLLAQQLPLRNRLARELPTTRTARALEGGPELALPELPPNLVHLTDVLRALRENPRRLQSHHVCCCRTRTRFRSHSCCRKRKGDCIVSAYQVVVNWCFLLSPWKTP